MKKLTLNKTWTECLRMWRWIAKEKRAGNKSYIYNLKAEWLKKHGYVPNDKDVECNCFFCEYDLHKNDNCRACPPKKIEPKFDCRNEDYHFNEKPIAFYNKLVALNRKRIGKRRPQ